MSIRQKFWSIRITGKMIDHCIDWSCDQYREIYVDKQKKHFFKCFFVEKHFFCLKNVFSIDHWSRFKNLIDYDGSFDRHQYHLSSGVENRYNIGFGYRLFRFWFWLLLIVVLILVLVIAYLVLVLVSVLVIVHFGFGCLKILVVFRGFGFGLF